MVIMRKVITPYEKGLTSVGQAVVNGSKQTIVEKAKAKRDQFRNNVLKGNTILEERRNEAERPNDNPLVSGQRGFVVKVLLGRQGLKQVEKVVISGSRPPTRAQNGQGDHIVAYRLMTAAIEAALSKKSFLDAANNIENFFLNIRTETEIKFRTSTIDLKTGNQMMKEIGKADIEDLIKDLKKRAEFIISKGKGIQTDDQFRMNVRINDRLFRQELAFAVDNCVRYWQLRTNTVWNEPPPTDPPRDAAFYSSMGFKGRASSAVKTAIKNLLNAEDSENAAKNIAILIDIRPESLVPSQLPQNKKTKYKEYSDEAITEALRLYAFINPNSSLEGEKVVNAINNAPDIKEMEKHLNKPDTQKKILKPF